MLAEFLREINYYAIITILLSELTLYASHTLANALAEEH